MNFELFFLFAEICCWKVLSGQSKVCKLVTISCAVLQSRIWRFQM